MWQRHTTTYFKFLFYIFPCIQKIEALSIFTNITTTYFKFLFYIFPCIQKIEALSIFTNINVINGQTFFFKINVMDPSFPGVIRDPEIILE